MTRDAEDYLPLVLMVAAAAILFAAATILVWRF